MLGGGGHPKISARSNSQFLFDIPLATTVAAVAAEELALADEITKRDGTSHLFSVGHYLTCAIQ